MLLDKNGKLFGKLSIIDLGIILIVIVCVVGVGMRFSGGLADISSQSVEIEYVYEMKQIRQTSVDALNKMGEVYNKTAGEAYMGTITHVEALANDDFSILADGNIVKTSAPERYDALVTIRVPGKQSDNALYTASNQRLEAGSHEFFSTKWVAGEGDIKSVKVISQ